MATNEEKLQTLIEYRSKIERIQLSETAIADFVSIVYDLISYLKNTGGYPVATDGLKQDIIMVDRNVKMGWKPGTQGSKHFAACKRDALTTLGYLISGAEHTINKVNSGKD